MPIPAVESLTQLPPRQASRPAPAPAKTPAPAKPVAAKKSAPNGEPEDTRVQYEDYPLPPYSLLKYEPVSDEYSGAAQREMMEVQ